MNVDIKIECETAEDFERIMRQLGRSPKVSVNKKELNALLSIQGSLQNLEVNADNMEMHLKSLVKNQPKGGGLGYDPTIKV